MKVQGEKIHRIDKRAGYSKTTLTRTPNFLNVGHLRHLGLSKVTRCF